MNEFMKAAIDEAFIGMSSNDGGPFGAVIVQNGKIIAKGHNEVLKNHDPTAHAEMVVIRKAARLLNRFDLSDCEIYSSCEPCPMCFAAIHWAKMKKLYYGCTRQDAADIGFDDQYIYDVIKNTAIVKQVEVVTINRDECLKAFEEWRNKEGKTMY